MPAHHRWRGRGSCSSAFLSVANAHGGGCGEGVETQFVALVETNNSDLHDFGWQNGYEIFSIGYSQIEAVREYIAGQEEHHRKVSFQDEFRQLLKRYEIGYDERYVWD